jgi:RNA methyltransferase, TrmH family
MLSRTHALARRLRALRTDAALREAEGVFVAEGTHLAADALNARAVIEAAVVSPRLALREEGRELRHRLDEAGVEVHTTSEAILAGLQDARSPQPVVLIVKREPVSLEKVLAGRGGTPLVVVACGVQEPGTLGALWRTADAAGATGFCATEASASLTHPRTVRASMGAVFRLPAVDAEVGSLLEELESRGLRVYGAEARGAAEYDQVPWEGPTALLLGGEGAGLPEAALARVDLRLVIPMAPGVDSLSVNAAAAVILFEAARKRRAINRGG